MFGIIDMGFGFNQKINLTQAAREASRYGATLSFKASNSTNTGTVTTWLAKVTSVAQAAGGSDLAATRSGRYICVAYIAKDGTASSQTTGSGGPAANAPCYSDGRSSEDRVQVVVRSNTVVDFMFLGGKITVGSSSVTHYEASTS